MDLLPLDLFLLHFSWASSAALDSQQPCFVGSLDSSHLSLPLLPLQHHLLLGLLGTWMQPQDPDREIIELSFEFSGISIAVRGSPSRAADFVRNLHSTPSASEENNYGFSEVLSEPSHIGSSVSGFSVVHREEPSVALDTSTVHRPETRRTIWDSFPPCPANWLGVPAAQLVGSRLTGQQRVQRAWTAGSWARAVREGRIGSPNQTPAIELGNRFWCVLYSSRVPRPAVYTTSGRFFAAVGRLAGSDTICHGFPTETEARVYFEAAGISYPSQYN